MTKRYFITGTDAQVGKTRVSELLLKSANQRGLATLGLKPIATGADWLDERWSHHDARMLMAASSVKLDYAQVNPLLFKEDVAPHIAAYQEKKRLTVQSISGYCRGTFMTAKADFTVVEGIGGWKVPLNFTETQADLVKELKMDAILIVGIRPGCLNHAILTAESIEQSGVSIRGWVANSIEPEMPTLNEHIQTLQRMLRAPLIGVLSYLKETEDAPENWVNPAVFDS